MAESNNNRPDDNANTSKSERLTIRNVIVFAGMLFIGLSIIAYIFVNKDSVRINFLTSHSINLFIFVAIAIQAIIYRKQWHVMEKQFIQTQRAYISIFAVDTHPTNQRMLVLQFENIGRIPADDLPVTVTTLLLVPTQIVRNYPDSDRKDSAHTWWVGYGRTKFFPGNLKIELRIPLESHLSDVEHDQVAGGYARLISQVRLEYHDGFTNQRSDYAFRFDIAKWIPWPVWTDDVIESRIAEEWSRYYPS